MPQNFNDVTFLFPNSENISDIISHKSFVPFDEKICEFLDEVSKKLLKDADAKAYPDVITFGFFCRKASISSIKKNYEGKLEGRLGRGVTFHIAPSNVPINFAYSLVAGLLAGNRCIVRASSKDFPQTRIVCRAFNQVLEEENFSDIKNIFSVVMYGHNEEITSSLSLVADVRIVWGGDNTIAEIRKSPLKPRAFEITFADRYSIAVFNAKYVLEQNELKGVAQGFYNDTYLYDQNACSSPRFIYWIGKEDECEKAKEKFWSAVYDNINGKYELAPILAVDKLTAQYKCAVELEQAKIQTTKDNLITRIKIAALPNNITDYTCAGGAYLEYNSESLDSLSSIISNKFQTLSYLGMNPEEMRNFIIENGLCGVDRIVPVGKTADFGFVWDGYDLITQMSRIVFETK